MAALNLSETGFVLQYTGDARTVPMLLHFTKSATADANNIHTHGHYLVPVNVNPTQPLTTKTFPVPPDTLYLKTFNTYADAESFAKALTAATKNIHGQISFGFEQQPEHFADLKPVSYIRTFVISGD